MNTGFTDAEIDAAIRKQSLLRDARKTPHRRAVEDICISMWEHGLAEFDHTADPQEWWDKMPKGSQLMQLDHATWLIGRLHRAGFQIVSIEMLRRAAGL